VLPMANIPNGGWEVSVQKVKTGKAVPDSLRKDTGGERRCPFPTVF